MRLRAGIAAWSRWPITAAWLIMLFSSVCLAQSPLAPATTVPAGIRLSTDFPGGSALVQSIDQATRTIRIAPGGNIEQGWVCWWYFKLEGLDVGSTITIEVSASGWGRPDRAQFSYDNKTWTQTDPGELKARNLHAYQHKVTAPQVWFAWGPPFVLRDANELIDSVCRRSPHATRFELARTRGGRVVPAARIMEPSDTAEADRFGVWVQARHHAWEAGSSWVAAGFVDWLISDDPRAEALRKRADVYFVPIMDVDSVEIGAGGKNQKPHDHQWDWGPDPIFPEVRAAMERIGAMQKANRFDVFIDMHNPEAAAREVFFYTPAKPLLVPERLEYQNAFLEIAKQEITGEVPFTGRLGPQGATYDPISDPSAECWVANSGRPHVVALTMETAWNTPHGTQSGYRKTGAQIGRTIEHYLRSPQRQAVRR